MEQRNSRLCYPATRRDEQVFEHGEPDPYRWLEDPDAPETQEWVVNQNKITEELLESSDVRQKFKERLTDLYNYPKYSCPFKRGSRYFHYKNNGLQNQSVLYVQDSLEAEPQEFLDPNKLSEDGTASLGVTAFSDSGDYFAYGIARSGSDWQTIFVKRVSVKEDLTDKLSWIKFSSIAWTHDEKGFFYARYPQPSNAGSDLGTAEDPKAGAEVDTNVDQQVYYHRLGASQEEDVLIYSTPEDPKLMFGAEVTDDGAYLLLTTYRGTAPVNKFYYAALDGFEPKQGGLNIVKLIDNFDAEYQYVANEGSVFYLKTNLNAPKNKLIAIDIHSPSMDSWRDIIAESKDVMSYVTCYNEKHLFVCYIRDVKDVVVIHKLVDGSFERELTLPALGTISSVASRKKDEDVFYSFTSFLHPNSIYRLASDGTVTLFREAEIKGFDASLFKTEQVFYESKDKTKVPMFIVSKKDSKMDGTAAVYLYGYGGFNINIQPTFSVFRLVLMNHCNVTLAIPNIRGGGEYGEEWHKAGTFEKKQNVFDDFCAAAEYLIANKYTCPERLAISGGSNGGLLVGACANQNPHLFGCVIAQVGVFDMLRFHKFTIGHAWTAEYGCADKPEELLYLKEYSPLHNVRPDAAYPAILLTTADHDDRVVPLHSYKFISTLQHVVGSQELQKQPLMILVSRKAGHGAGKPTTKAIQETADIYTFIYLTLKLQWHG